MEWHALDRVLDHLILQVNGTRKPHSTAQPTHNTKFIDQLYTYCLKSGEITIRQKLGVDCFTYAVQHLNLMVKFELKDNQITMLVYDNGAGKLFNCTVDTKQCTTFVDHTVDAKWIDEQVLNQHNGQYPDDYQLRVKMLPVAEAHGTSARSSHQRVPQALGRR